jgi:hypothetical protein
MKNIIGAVLISILGLMMIIPATIIAFQGISEYYTTNESIEQISENIFNTDIKLSKIYKLKSINEDGSKIYKITQQGACGGFADVLVKNGKIIKIINIY